MTLPELIERLWEVRATVVLLDGKTKTPVLRGLKPAELAPEMLAALKEHREEIVRLLSGIGGARLEGLVCGACVPAAVPSDPIKRDKGLLRACDRCKVAGQTWPTQHYPRVS
jgi:hypothetical protein